MVKLISIKEPTAVDHLFEVSGNGTYCIRQNLRQLGFEWNKNNRTWWCTFENVTACGQKIKYIVKQLHDAATLADECIEFKSNNNKKALCKRKSKSSKSRFIDESIMNANNKYTVGREIDGKKINTQHEYLSGDESESVDINSRVSVKECNGRVEFYGKTFDHRELLKDEFGARWDPTQKVWWILSHGNDINKIKYVLKEYGIYANDGDDDEYIEEDEDYEAEETDEEGNDEEYFEDEDIDLKSEVMDLMDNDTNERRRNRNKRKTDREESRSRSRSRRR